MSTLDDIGTLLRRHRLGPMADRLILQSAHRDRRPFLERLTELVQALDEARTAKAMANRARTACLPMADADLAELWTSAERNLLQRDIAPFQDAGWVRRKQHLVVVGASGRGKTYLACALAQAVLRQGLSVRYAELPTLLADWHMAHEEGRHAQFVRSIERADLLVVDDWGNTDETLGPRDLVALRRCLRPMLERRSVLVASKKPPEDLEQWLGGREIAGELVDWLSETHHRLELKGPSLRGRVRRARQSRGSLRGSR